MRNALLSLTILTTLLTACGGGSGGSGSSGGPATGRFLDSAVTGLAWASGARTGFTGANGEFEYDGGSNVEFSIGDTDLGLSVGRPVLTPVNLVAGAVNETDQTVTNMIRLLQTLDTDSDPENGIDIAGAVHTAFAGVQLDFAQSIAAFEADPEVAAALSSVGRSGLVAQFAARTHLRETLFGIQAGRYRGTFSGDDSGPWQFLLTRTGALIGWGTSSEGFFDFTGTVDSAGFGSFGGTTSTAAAFNGQIRDGSVSGSWINTSIAEMGGFVGDQVEAVAPRLDPLIVQQIQGSYNGSATVGGVTTAFTLQIDGDGNVTLVGGGAEFVLGETSAGGATVLGLDEDGTTLDGNVTVGGVFSGTFRTLDGETGPLDATRV